MPEIVNFVDLPNFYGYADPSLAEAADSTRIDMRLSYGKNVSLAVATCQPGYHPAAQIHSSEQINYIAEGELWVYVEGSAYHLKEGDAIRIPSGVVHWMWNRSDEPCTFYESNCPPLAGHVPAAVHAGGLSGAVPPETQARLPQVVWLSEKYSREVEEKDLPPVEGPLMARAATLATSVHGGAIGAAAAGKLTSKCVHGLHHNMTLARRKGSYHSAPHIHDAEQLHFVVSGDIDIYRDDCGFSCKPGDFNIIPRNSPHWAHVTSDDDNILLQAHSPVLGSAANRKALLTDAERALPVPTVFNMTPWRERDIMTVEEAFVGKMRRS
jgi:quercetin dioxygenase-like cupin family protein